MLDVLDKAKFFQQRISSNSSSKQCGQNKSLHEAVVVKIHKGSSNFNKAEKKQQRKTTKQATKERPTNCGRWNLCTTLMWYLIDKARKSNNYLYFDVIKNSESSTKKDESSTKKRRKCLTFHIKLSFQSSSSNGFHQTLPAKSADKTKVYMKLSW